MRELVEFLCRSIAHHPEEVRVTEAEDGDAVVFDIRVAAEDTGRIIGRQGRVIGAIRTVVRSAAPRGGKRIMVRVDES